MKGAIELSSWVQNPHKHATPFNAGVGTDLDLFQWYEAEPKRGRRFNANMGAAADRMFPSKIFLEGAVIVVGRTLAS